MINGVPHLRKFRRTALSEGHVIQVPVRYKRSNPTDNVIFSLYCIELELGRSFKATRYESSYIFPADVGYGRDRKEG